MAYKVSYYVTTQHQLDKLILSTQGFGHAQVEIVEGSPLDPERPGRKMSYAGGRRDKGINGNDLFLDSVSKHTLSLEELSAIFVEWSFAESSAASYGSALKKKGFVRRNQDLTWSITPQGEKFAEAPSFRKRVKEAYATRAQ